MPRPRVPLYVPDVALETTGGTPLNLRKRAGLSVLFIYPYTGRPNYADPLGWDKIRGAHGSTPQALGYKALFHEFRILKAGIFGISFQDTEWQSEFAERNHLPFVLLSDTRADFASKLGLRTFTAGGRAYLNRRTFVIRDGRVVWDQREVPKPEQDAANILAWLRKA
jgi:peroxiredoxin